MNELFISKACLWTEPADDGGAALAALRASIGPRAARRMTRLGMMLSAVMERMELTEESSVVYATTFSETCAIEKFLQSFPFPSPQLFQTSIHPSAAEQYLIQHNQAVREFFPLAGHAGLLARALDCVLQCAGETRVLCGGEERGTWLYESKMTSETNHAWALQLSESAEDAEGSIRWLDDGRLDASGNLLAEFLSALEQRIPMRSTRAGDGFLELSWSE